MANPRGVPQRSSVSVRFVLLAAAVVGACGRDRPDTAPSSVSVGFLDQDSAGVRFRVCNNGFQPIRRVEFTAGASTFSADTVLGQAHCAEVRLPGAYPDLTSAPVLVTRAERP